MKTYAIRGLNIAGRLEISFMPDIVSDSIRMVTGGETDQGLPFGTYWVPAPDYKNTAFPEIHLRIQIAPH